MAEVEEILKGPEGEEGLEEFLIPPKNFAMVERGIYRSEFPETPNFAFLDSLNLRSILYLCGKPYPEKSTEFFQLRGVRLFHLSIDGRKTVQGSLAGNTENAIADALKILTDSRNHPVLILSKRGKRTGSIVVGCLRKLQSWSMASVIDEYQRFTAKTRISDLRFIEAVDMSRIKESRNLFDTFSR